MPSSYKLATLDQLHGWLVASYAGWFPDDDVSEGSDNWKRLRVIALSRMGEQHHLKTIYDDLLPDSCRGVMQDRWGGILKRPRKQATPAQKADALRCFGTVGQSVPDGSELFHADGTRYKTVTTTTITSGTYVDVDVIAIDTGSATRKNKGEKLTFSTPPVGIEASAELQLDLDQGGDDVEEDEDYRIRLLDAIAQPGAGGNPNDWKTWAEEVSGVKSAFPYRRRGGLGSVHIACFRSSSGAGRALSAPDRQEVYDYLFSKSPISIADLFVLETIAEPVDVEIVILPEDGAANQFDWDDVATPVTVESYTSGTRTLKLSGASRPADMEVGDRVFWRSAAPPYHDGSEAEIEAFGGAADEVVLRAPKVGEYDWTATPPVAGDDVYSGGPLVEPIRQAVIEHIDAMGPPRGTHAATRWVGTLYLAQIFKVAQTTEGVLDSEILAPLNNVTATNTPPVPSLGYLIPRVTIVRRAP